MTLPNTDLEQQLAAFREQNGIAAAGAAIVGPDGATAIAVDGVIAHDSSELVVLDDAWHIGSCAKAMTALTYAALVDEGLTQWKTPLSDVFADLSGIDDSWSKLTMEDLLHCRAGVKPNVRMRWLGDAENNLSLLTAKRTELAEQILAKPSKAPGNFVYSNVSYVLVGAAIDRLAGVPYETTIADRVMTPAGVTNFGFGPAARLLGHHSLPKLPFIGKERLQPVNPGQRVKDNHPVYTPAGRIHLPLVQWAKIVAVFLNDHDTVVGAESRRRLTTPPADSDFAMGWRRHRDGGLVMQGSNTMNAATVQVGDKVAALVVANDGRRSTLQQSAKLADQLLAVV